MVLLQKCNEIYRRGGPRVKRSSLQTNQAAPFHVHRQVKKGSRR